MKILIAAENPRAAAFLDSIVNEFADSFLVESLEWVGIQNLVAEIVAHKGSDVIA